MSIIESLSLPVNFKSLNPSPIRNGLSNTQTSLLFPNKSGVSGANIITFEYELSDPNDPDSGLMPVVVGGGGVDGQTQLPVYATAGYRNNINWGYNQTKQKNDDDEQKNKKDKNKDEDDSIKRENFKEEKFNFNLFLFKIILFILFYYCYILLILPHVFVPINK